MVYNVWQVSSYLYYLAVWRDSVYMYSLYIMYIMRKSIMQIRNTKKPKTQTSSACHKFDWKIAKPQRDKANNDKHLAREEQID